MPKRDWRTNLALGLIAPFVIVVGYGFVQLATSGELPSCKNTDPRSGYAATDPKNAAMPQSIYYQLSCHDPAQDKDGKCQAWRQAEVAQEQACLARYQFWIGSAIALFGLAGLFLTLDANRQTADAAVATLVASQRAWIRRDKITFASPLIFRDDGLVYTSVVLHITNVGNAPALHVHIRAILLGATDGEAPHEKALHLFNAWRQYSVYGGFPLFPKQAYPTRDFLVRHATILSKEDADAATDGDGRMTLYLATCINYSFSSDPTRNHQTSCLFEIRSHAHPFIMRETGEIQDKELWLMEELGVIDSAD